MTEKFRIFNYCFFLLCIPTMLLAQNKDISFTDVTKEAGIDFKYTFGDATYENILESSGSGITVFDYNNDGYMDLYLMNGTYLEGISDPEGKIFNNSRNKLCDKTGLSALGSYQSS